MNATTDNGERQTRTGGPNPSAAELERQGEKIRAGLDRTLDEIEHKASPGQLLDQSVEFLRSHASDFLAEAAQTVRRHPGPVLVSAAGLVWLTSSILKSRSAASRDDTPAEDSFVHRGSGYGQAGVGVAPEMTRKAKGQVANSVDAVKDRTKGAMHAVQARTQAAGSRFGNLVKEQPAALGAMALAAGALIGAALPITPYENRVFGPVHDRTMARAKELGQREFDNISETVTSSLKGTSSSGAPEKAAEQSPAAG